MTANEGQLAFTGLEPPEPEPEPAPVAEVAAPVAPPRSFEPTAEQATAIASRERHAFLEAGAGSGKTTVLVDRYCAAIVEDAVEVDRILAFTFTERAAAEMRTRIRRELVARSQAVREAGDGSRADELLQAARATERAWVMTIHAFCRRLLGSHPLAAGLDPRFRVLDASEAGRLADRAANEALDELLAAGDADVARAAAAYQPWRITQMTTGAHARLRSQGMSEPRLPPVGDPAHSPGRREEQRELTPAELEAAASARTALERLLEGFDRRYATLKEQRSALDFQDLELGALELLRASPALAAAWRERFTHVMVDEFQDTNSVQLELIERLCGPETRLLLVGDENQSIYRFRNAELEVFRGERAKARDAADRDLLPLLGNFRSLPAVLAGVNEVGRTLLDGFAELTSGRRRERPRRGGRAPADARRGPRQGGAQVGPRGDRPRAAAGRVGAANRRRGALPRRAPARAGRRRRTSSGARSSSSCAPSPTSTPTRRRCGGRACGRSWSAVAATGPSSRSRTSSACSGSSPTRSTTSTCSAPWPASRTRSAPTRSGCCAAPPATRPGGRARCGS